MQGATSLPAPRPPGAPELEVPGERGAQEAPLPLALGAQAALEVPVERGAQEAPLPLALGAQAALGVPEAAAAPHSHVQTPRAPEALVEVEAPRSWQARRQPLPQPLPQLQPRPPCAQPPGAGSMSACHLERAELAEALRSAAPAA